MDTFIRVRSAEGPEDSYLIHKDVLDTHPERFVVVGEEGDVVEPPRTGTGSTTDAWAAYAKATGIEVPDDAKRDDIIALVDGTK